MENGLPRKNIRRPESESPKFGEILNFTSAILALVSTAIFYFAGWVYVSHWYSFYGIDASQLDIPIYLILVHGVPGIFILAATALISIAFISMLKITTKKIGLNITDIPIVVIIAYTLAFVVLLYIIYRFSPIVFSSWDELLLLPAEVIVSLAGVFLIGFIFYFFVIQTFLNDKRLPWGRTFSAQLEHLDKGDLLGFGKLVSKQFSYFLERFYDASKLSNIQRTILASSLKYVELDSMLVQTWQFWSGLILLLYFLISVSTSTLFGEWDARLGRKSMVGGWKVEETFLFSSDDALALPKDLSKSNPASNSYAYGPLFLLGKDGNTYYLTDWTDKLPYTQKPNVYVVLVPDSKSLGIQMFAPTPIMTYLPKPSALPATSKTPRPTITTTTIP